MMYFSNLEQVHGSALAMLLWICLGTCMVRITLAQSTDQEVMRGPFPSGQADINLGGLVPVHLFDSATSSCPVDGIQGENLQWVEAMHHAVEQINNDTQLLDGITLGYEIRDTCRIASHAVVQSLEFLGRSDGKCDASNGADGFQTSVVGVVGAFSSAVSLRVTVLLDLFGIPMVSYGSTSSQFSSKAFPWFLRTIPSDNLAAQGIAEVVQNLTWDFIGLVHTSDAFGRDGINQVKKALGLPQVDECSANAIVDVCEAFTREISVDAVGTAVYDSIWRELLFRSPVNHTTIVVLFTQEGETREFFNFAEMSNDTVLMAEARRKNITFIGVDAWGDIITAVQGARDIAKGSVSVIPLATAYEPFKIHWTNLNPATNTGNPWLRRYWEETFNCNVSSDACTRDNSLSTNFVMSSKVPYVYHSVYAFAHALDSLYRTNCSKGDSVCLRDSVRKHLLQALRDVRFNTINNSPFFFDANGDPGISAYDIKNMVVGSGPGDTNISFPVVGLYSSVANSSNEATFNLSRYNVVWNSGENVLPVSVCSADCRKGEQRAGLTGAGDCQDCCWMCVTCAMDTISTTNNSDNCTECSPATRSNADHTECLAVPVDEYAAPLAFPIILIILATFGVLGTLVAITQAVHKFRTSFFIFGRGPTFCVLFAFLLSYVSVLLESGGPTEGICLGRSIMATVGLTAVTATTFVFVLHRWSAASKMFFGAILVYPGNRLWATFALEVVAAALMTIFCVAGDCTSLEETPTQHVKLERGCGFQDVDIVVLAYLCMLNAATLVICIYVMWLVQHKKMPGVVYDPNSRMFAMIAVAAGLSLVLTVGFLGWQSVETVPILIKDCILHLQTMQFATSFLVLTFLQPLRKLGQLSKEDEDVYTKELETTTRTSRSWSIDFTIRIGSKERHASTEKHSSKEKSSSGKTSSSGRLKPAGSETSNTLRVVVLSAGDVSQADGTDDISSYKEAQSQNIMGDSPQKDRSRSFFLHPSNDVELSVTSPVVSSATLPMVQVSSASSGSAASGSPAEVPHTLVSTYAGEAGGDDVGILRTRETSM